MHSTQDYGAAQKHFLRGGQVAEHARAVASWARKGYKSEADMFVTRTVLQVRSCVLCPFLSPYRLGFHVLLALAPSVQLLLCSLVGGFAPRHARALASL